MEVEKAIQKSVCRKMWLCRRRYSQYWRLGSITNVSISKNCGSRSITFVVENQIGEIRWAKWRNVSNTLEELRAFLGINILMGIHKLPKMRDYWSVDEGLGNILIQKTMTGDRFLEILQNHHFADNLQKSFFTSPNLMLKLFEDETYITGTVKSNLKYMPTLKANNQMKRGEYDWLECDTISATKWMDNRSVILLSNYHNPSVVQEIKRRVKGSKKKVKLSCPAVIREYNTYMGGVDLCDQMKVSYEVDRRNKVRFYLWEFFDFLDISVGNSTIVYDKIQSTTAMSSMDFRFSLARSMIGTFSNRKRVIPTSRPSKRSKGEIAVLVDHLPQFAATRARCAYCSLIKIENHTFTRCM